MPLTGLKITSKVKFVFTFDASYFALNFNFSEEIRTSIKMVYYLSCLFCYIKDSNYASRVVYDDEEKRR